VATIDQKVVIAASAEAVWRVLGNATLLIKWRKSCKQISVLSTQQSGVGARWRLSLAQGKPVIEEVSQWLDNVGYRYTMIEGAYRSFKGTFRLQPIPEGTIVNWTVEYQLRGILVGPRNVLGRRRRAERQMADDLKELRRLVERSGAQFDAQSQARFAMKAAPNVEERAILSAALTAANADKVADPATTPTVANSSAKAAPANAALVIDPREKRAVPAAPPASPTPTVAPSIFDDEPISVRPLQPTDLPKPVTSSVVAPAIVVPEPSFLASAELTVPVAAANSAIADTKPRKPKELAEALAQAAPEWNSEALTVPISLVAPKTEPTPAPIDAVTNTISLSTTADTLPDTQTVQFVSLAKPSAPTPPKPTPPFNRLPVDAALPPPTDPTDTGQMSIYDIFKMQRPSDHHRDTVEMTLAAISSTGNFQLNRRAEALKRVGRRRLRGGAPAVRRVATPQRALTQPRKVAKRLARSI
jgi:uncharacterized membrane protein